MPMTEKRRYVKESHVEMTQLVLPNDTNQLGNLHGGRLMEWIDVAAAIAAQRHSNRICVTIAVDQLVFHEPIHLGEVVTVRAVVNRAFATSMEVGVEVLTENQLTGKRKLTNTAFLTFVAVDDDRPVKVKQIIPQTAEERRKFKDALLRRKRRLTQRNYR